MKKAALVFILGLVVAVAAYAQGTPQTKSGNNALMFSINGFGDFGVTPSIVGWVPGSGFGLIDSAFSELNFVRPVAGPSMRMFLSDNLALRAGIGLNIQSTDPNDTNGTETSQMAFAIAPGIEVHLAQAGPVTFYTGGVLSFAMASSSRQGVNAPDSTKSTSSQTGIGIGAILGAEFFAWNNLSFSAEYQFGAIITSQSQEQGSFSRDLEGVTNIGFSGPVRVTVALTFD